MIAYIIYFQFSLLLGIGKGKVRSYSDVLGIKKKKIQKKSFRVFFGPLLYFFSETIPYLKTRRSVEFEYGIFHRI